MVTTTNIYVQRPYVLMRGKRFRHAGGVSWVVMRRNEHGEWCLVVEPENVQVDNVHGGGVVHVHDPRNHGIRTAVGSVSAEEAYRLVIAHLRREGTIRLVNLCEELRSR